MMEKSETKKKFSFAKGQQKSSANSQMEVKSEPKTSKMNIFKMTEQIDRKIKEYLINIAYLLVGRSRSGKSTAMNWINQYKLKGVK